MMCGCTSQYKEPIQVASNRHNQSMTMTNGLLNINVLYMSNFHPDTVKPGKVNGLRSDDIQNDSLTVRWTHPDELYPDVLALVYQLNFSSQLDDHGQVGKRLVGEMLRI